jgi:alkaline phosphatase D
MDGLKLLVMLLLMAFGSLSSAQLLQLKAVAHRPLDMGQRLEKIAFGSCNRHYNTQKFWRDIVAGKPQLWIWGGDNVYADAKNPERLKVVYDEQNADPDYAYFRSQVPLLGIWDDHDYGPNNSDARLPFKAQSQQLFLDFMGVAKDSPLRLQKGIYSHHLMGPPDQQVSIIALDNRYFKTSKTLLGETQWQWLESVLKTQKAKVTIFVLGVPYAFADVAYSEEWSDYPEEKKKLRDLIQKYDVSGPILLSGDKHFTHFLTQDQLLEVMASGLTHTLRKPLRPVVRKLYPGAIIAKNWAELTLDWSHSPLRLTVAVLGEKRRTFRQEKYLLDKGRWVAQPLP